jgi:response regulator RpfG family c-di-GMP phosphodiesterase
MYSKSRKSSILLIDDTPANIDIIAEILKREYQVRVVTTGELALKIANSKNPPDLVLLDIMMPGMDGYEVCRRLKAEEKTKEIPVIFLTCKGEVEDETKGLSLGAVDYITKPFEPAIVKARVKTHLALRKAEEELQDLLSQTLVGSIRVLIELLSLVKPEVFSKASRLRRYVKGITGDLAIKDAWQYELAAMLSHIGFISLHDEIINKVINGQELSDEEEKIFHKYPAVGAALVSRIPRMGTVAGMIERLQVPFSNITTGRDLLKSDPFVLGGQMLKVVNDYDQLISRGLPPDVALKQMSNDKMTYEPTLLNKLKEVLNVQQSERYSLELKVSEMREGMILDEDIYSSSGPKVLLVAKGTEISNSRLSRLHMLEKIGLVTRPIRVLVLEEDKS